MNRFSLIVCLLLGAGMAGAQSVENVHFAQTEDDQVVITYDLAQAEGQKFTVEVWVSPDGGQTFTIQPQSVRGDVGEGVEGGGSKKIVWEVLSDIRKLEGAGFVVKVVAIEVSHQGRVEKLPGGATMEFVWIEPGTFVMGSPDSELLRGSDEGPQHKVTITKGFYLGKYEITQGWWEGVMGTKPWSGQARVQEGPNYPAVYISWNDVQALVHKLNQAAGDSLYRLPTEAEWEYACRAGTTTRWSFGDKESQLGNYAWYRGNSWDVGKQYLHAVGMKQPNPWGLYDMHGKVWEWVQDWYGGYSSTGQVDPTGPASGSSRVFRGGYFDIDARWTRSASRGDISPGNRDYYIGARLLRTR